MLFYLLDIVDNCLKILKIRFQFPVFMQLSVPQQLSPSGSKVSANFDWKTMFPETYSFFNGKQEKRNLPAHRRRTAWRRRRRADRPAPVTLWSSSWRFAKSVRGTRPVSRARCRTGSGSGRAPGSGPSSCSGLERLREKKIDGHGNYGKIFSKIISKSSKQRSNAISLPASFHIFLT